MDIKNTSGGLFVVIGVLFLVTVLPWTLSTLQGFSNLSHEQQMKELELKKEIALINNDNNTIIIKDYECEYRLATQTIQYQQDMIQLERYYTGK